MSGDVATGSPGGEQGPRWAAILIPAVVFFVTFFAYTPALHNTLVAMDDLPTLEENVEWRGLRPENIRWMFTNTPMGHWQPLSWLTFAIDYEVAGHPEDLQKASEQIHRTSLLLHSADAVLLYLVVLRLMAAVGWRIDLAARLGAALGVLLWSVHPLRVES